MKQLVEIFKKFNKAGKECGKAYINAREVLIKGAYFRESNLNSIKEKLINYDWLNNKSLEYGVDLSEVNSKTLITVENKMPNGIKIDDSILEPVFPKLIDPELITQEYISYYVQENFKNMFIPIEQYENALYGNFSTEPLSEEEIIRRQEDSKLLGTKVKVDRLASLGKIEFTEDQVLEVREQTIKAMEELVKIKEQQILNVTGIPNLGTPNIVRNNKIGIDKKPINIRSRKIIIEED
jgi:hypothetical protein